MGQRLFIGDAPENGESFAHDLKTGWTLFLLVDKSDNRFLNLKLTNMLVACRKANFWLGWDIKKSRFTGNRDLGMLKEHYPALFEWTADAVSRHIRARSV